MCIEQNKMMKKNKSKTTFNMKDKEYDLLSSYQFCF